MGKPTGFKEIPREMPKRRPVELRMLDWNEIYIDFAPKQTSSATRARAAWTAAFRSATTAARSGNIIPEWNDLVYKNRWRDALDMLFKTNNFPEFTGRICPAPCEEACVLGINEKPVTIKLIEQNIIDHAFERTAGSSRSRRRRARARRSPSSAPARRASAARRSSTRPGTSSPSSSGPTASAGCSCTASPTSSSKRTSSIAASS